MRKSESYYLTYALIDATVGHYFFILEKVGEKLEQIDEELLENPKSQTLQSIHSLKTEMYHFAEGGGCAYGQKQIYHRRGHQ